MSLFNRSAPSAEKVQRQYVDKRLRAINRSDSAKEQAVETKIKQLLAADGHAHIDWLNAYRGINTSLQTAELTINLDAAGWFSRQNTYGSYAQMYERGVKDGATRLADQPKGNQAVTRAQADDIVTLPESWGKAHPLSQRRRLHNALSATGSSTAKDPAARNNVKTDNVRLLATGSDSGGGTRSLYAMENKHFNPLSKQVFAALNYGRREHGACTYYGYSHLILKPAVKQRALYYPGDTFFLALGVTAPGLRSQTSYMQLGALLQHASDALTTELWNACHKRLVQLDTDRAELLVEAHLFQEVKVAEDVEALVLSRTREAGKPPLSNAQWQQILVNAREWCTRNHVRLIFASC